MQMETALAASQTLANSQSELQAKTEELAAAKSQLSELATKAQDLEATQSNLQQQTEALTAAEAEIQALKTAAVSVDADRATLEKVSTAKQAAEEKIGKLETQLGQLTDSLEGSKQREQSLQKSLSSAEKQIAELTSTAGDQKQLTELLKEKDALAAQLSKSDTVSKELDDLQARFEEKEKELTKLNNQVTELASASQELERLRQKLEQVNQKNSALEEQIKALQKERDQVLMQAKDSDNDGVSDADDRCANTLAGISVDATGCEKDSDGDGLLDSRDLCPDSATGSVVDGLGCKQNENIILADVTFALGTANLTEETQRNLKRVAEILVQFPEITLEVAGYTDNIGEENRNRKLSKLRATSVMNYLVEQGVSADKLTAKGFGQADPIADNATAQGRAKNRRVELHRVAETTDEQAPAAQ